MKEKHLRRWERTRARGRTRYVFVYWVLFWGCTTGIVVTLVQEGPSASISDWLVALIVYPAVGWLMGTFAWKYTERVYANHVRESSDLQR